MNKLHRIIALASFVIAPVVMLSCSRSDESETVPTDRGAWLSGDVDERFALVAKHLRGLDMAMVEVGYRYTELYWASQDRNWEYAAYQLAKIEKAMANGVERRPLRAPSALMLDTAVQQVRVAITDRDEPGIDAAIETLTTTCDACHKAEQFGFITVVPPSVRATPIRITTADDQAEPAAP